MRRVSAAILLWVGLVQAATPGGGSPLTDCLTEFTGTAANRPVQRPKDIRCVDNDPACDDDPTLGVCGFHIGVCLNVTDANLPTCLPADLDHYVVDNPQPDTNPEHDFDFQGLQDALEFLALPVDASQQDVCVSDVPMSVYLRTRFRIGSMSWRRHKKLLRTSVSGPGEVGDDDKMRLICIPADDTTPCDGVTSTFDQLQQRIFTPTSCARSTCHNVQQGAHDLSLSPGDAYANLVGVEPANLVARNAGKLRVDPGNPTNSFIVDKLRGTLVAGEGDRMPLELQPLPGNAIRVLEEWIAAGAPATGFVAPSGCPGP